VRAGAVPSRPRMGGNADDRLMTASPLPACSAACAAMRKNHVRCTRIKPVRSGLVLQFQGRRARIPGSESESVWLGQSPAGRSR
jgi:hypothetical protein